MSAGKTTILFLLVKHAVQIQWMMHELLEYYPNNEPLCRSIDTQTGNILIL